VYEVRFAPEAVADIKSLPKNVRNSLKKEIRKLAANPIGPSLDLREPLQAWRSYHWRDYRVIFMIFEDLKTIAIAAVGKRLPGSQTDVYRKLERLAKEGTLAEKILRTLRKRGS
jgi:mRNA-degrading endonuclease RelE of RelBE toxin-antitoxin system